MKLTLSQLPSYLGEANTVLSLTSVSINCAHARDGWTSMTPIYNSKTFREGLA